MFKFLKVGAQIKNRMLPFANWLAHYRLNPVKCNEDPCDYKGYSKRAVSILYLLLTMIGMFIAMATTKEYLYSGIGWICIVGILTFFAPERCPRCFSTNVERISKEEYSEYERKYLESVEQARLEVDSEEEFEADINIDDELLKQNI